MTTATQINDIDTFAFATAFDKGDYDECKRQLAEFGMVADQDGVKGYDGNNLVAPTGHIQLAMGCLMRAWHCDANGMKGARVHIDEWLKRKK